MTNPKNEVFLLLNQIKEIFHLLKYQIESSDWSNIHGLPPKQVRLAFSNPNTKILNEYTGRNENNLYLQPITFPSARE